jgi:tetratricopeptide (TPR) repeat protein
MTAMDFKKFLIILAVFLSALLIVQPALSAANMTEVLTGKNVATVTNYTDDLEKDAANKFYNYGEQSLNNREFENAIAYFDQALAANITLLRKTDALLYLYRDKGYAQIQLGKYSDAVATLDEGLASYPADTLLWNNRGVALEKLGKSEEALAAYDKAVSFDQNYTLGYVNKGVLLSKMGRYSEAVAAYSQANETKPFNEDILAGLEEAKKSEAESARTMTIFLAIVLVAVIGIVVWYIKFRKPAEPAPEAKKKKSKKK